MSPARIKALQAELARLDALVADAARQVHNLTTHLTFDLLWEHPVKKHQHRLRVRREARRRRVQPRVFPAR